MDTLFKFCCGVMEVIAVLSGRTYEEVNSIAFIYAEPAIVTFTAALPLLYLIYRLYRRRTPTRFALTGAAAVYFLPHAFGLMKLWQHYDMSLQAACELAYKDLEWLGETTGLGYQAVNILLFIVLFLFLTLLNIFLFTLLRNTVIDAPRAKKRKKKK
ncbi:MAG: hypothetical protein J6M53_03615 [Bacteroidaceae bacterium]|nr:hypothetical protein [Bacteroidaceae bacterium]